MTLDLECISKQILGERLVMTELMSIGNNNMIFGELVEVRVSLQKDRQGTV